MQGGGEGFRRVVFLTLPLIALVVVCCGLLAYARSISGALAFLAGRDLVAEPAGVDVGTGRDGEQTAVDIRIRNLTLRPIKVLGVVSACSCIQIVESPLEVGPRSAESVRVKVAFTGQPGSFSQTIDLYTDAPGQYRLMVPIRGAVRE